MTRRNFLPQSDEARQSLFDEIKNSKFKQTIAGLSLIFIGLFGLILPIMPGWALIFMGVVLLFPRWGSRIIKKIFAFFKLESASTPE